MQRGELAIHVRQKPGPRNSMGTVKYEFPNPYGIYLHDTPEKELMQKDDRQLSAGCIRLEDAKKLGEWLLKGNLRHVVQRPRAADRPAAAGSGLRGLSDGFGG